MPIITSLSGAFTQQLAATLTRISLTPSGSQANGNSGLWNALSAQVFSGDGRRIVFETLATDIVPGDTNGVVLDAVMRDLFAGTTTRVSLTTTGTQQASGNVLAANLSADGRYVFFAGLGTFVPNDTNNQNDVFRRDLLTGDVIRVTTDSAGGQISSMAGTAFSNSADGRYVVFGSAATTLVVGDTNNQPDVFRKDLITGAVERVSTATGGAQVSAGSSDASISADGRYVVFSSVGSSLVAGDTNAVQDIFVKDMVTGVTTRVSTDSVGGQANGASSVARISADGRFVTFTSAANNLVAGDTNGASDVFRKDLLTGSIVRVSTDSSGAQATGGVSDIARISADGRFVAFRSDATNLVTGDTNARSDVFLKDLNTGAITRVTVDGQTLSQITGPGTIFDLAISADGRFVAIDTENNTLVPGDTVTGDVFIYDSYRGAVQNGLSDGGKVVTLQVGTTGGDILDVSWGDGTSSNRAVTSRADATLSTFDHAYANAGRYTITAVSTNPGVLGAAVTTATAIIATDAPGMQVVSNGIDGLANSATVPEALSPNGRYVVLSSTATNLIPGSPSSNQFYWRDTQTGEIIMVSASAAGAPGNISTFGNAFASDDGARVMFSSVASNLLSGIDGNTASDIFLKNIRTGAVTLLSATQAGVQGNGSSLLTDASSDLTWIVLQSDSTNFGNGTGSNDTNAVPDIFLKNTQTGEIHNVSIANGVSGGQGNSASLDGRVSENGRYVAFTSSASNLVAGDTNLFNDVFLRDTQTNTTTRVSLGAGNAQINAGSILSDLSNDGSLVLFFTNAGLVGSDTNTVFDLYSRNIATGALTLVSATSGGTAIAGGVGSTPPEARYSADGRYVVFESSGQFSSADTNAVQDVFRKDLQTGELVRISSLDGNRGGSGFSGMFAAAADAQTIAFGTGANDLFGSTPTFTQTLLWKQGGALPQFISGTAGVDIVQASEISDIVSAGTGNDTLFLRGGNDTADGGAGNDLIAGGAGNDSIDGGSDIDTAVYTVARSGATVTPNGNGTVSVTTAADGSDTLRSIELLSFSDGLYTVGQFAAPGNAVVANFGPGAGGWSSQTQFPRHAADVTGDGRADILGFGQAGVFLSIAQSDGTFASPTLAVANFGQAAGWSNDNLYPRALADVNGDGRADIVGFGQSGVFVSLASASGTGAFSDPTFVLSNFGQASGWATQDGYARVLGDVNGDGMADIVGFGQAGVWVSLATGSGNFANPAFGLANFGQASGWSSDDLFHRELGDINGDGKADIVGFGQAGVWAALSLGGTSFAAPKLLLNNFGQSTGWTSQDAFARHVADVNGDGKADIVGFGQAGTYVSLASATQAGETELSPAAFNTSFFGQSNGWTSDNTYHRELADANGDKLADVIGFGQAGVYLATSGGWLIG